MPRPKSGGFNQGGIPGTRGVDPDKELKKYKPLISQSALSVTLGERLRRRCPPVNVKGDKPA